MRRRPLPSWIAACGLLVAVAGAAGDAADVERAREGVRTGRFVPLEQIVAWVSERYFGRLLEVEFEAEGDGEPPTYEVEWLTPQGHVVEFEFDARDGALLEIEGRGVEEARRP